MENKTIDKKNSIKIKEVQHSKLSESKSKDDKIKSIEKEDDIISIPNELKELIKQRENKEKFNAEDFNKYLKYKNINSN